jgi:hypothetical protein
MVYYQWHTVVRSQLVGRGGRRGFGGSGGGDLGAEVGEEALDGGYVGSALVRGHVGEELDLDVGEEEGGVGEVDWAPERGGFCVFGRCRHLDETIDRRWLIDMEERLKGESN